MRFLPCRRISFPREPVDTISSIISAEMSDGADSINKSKFPALALGASLAAPLVICSCGNGGGRTGAIGNAPAPVAFSYKIPADLNDSWIVASAASNGF
jgi:hypothetical protein